MTDCPEPSFRVGITIDSERDTVTLDILDIPLDYLEHVLHDMADPEWRQNISDAIRVGRIGLDMGMERTARNFVVCSGNDDDMEMA